MFDEVTKTEGGKRASRRAVWLAASLAIQTALALWLVRALEAHRAKVSRERVVEVKFVKGAAMPARPPPPPVRMPPHRERPKQPPRPVQAMVQPKAVPEEIEPPEPERPPEPEPADSSDKDQDGGAAGVVGGVVGGVEGGAVEAPSPPPRQEFDEATMKRPVFVSGPDPVYTQKALMREVEGLMIVKCVVTLEGRIRNCQVLKSLPFMDDAVVSALERRRYKPATLNGEPIEVDYVFRLNLTLPR